MRFSLAEIDIGEGQTLFDLVAKIKHEENIELTLGIDINYLLQQSFYSATNPDAVFVFSRVLG